MVTTYGRITVALVAEYPVAGIASGDPAGYFEGGVFEGVIDDDDLEVEHRLGEERGSPTMRQTTASRCSTLPG